jgi:hypothetical protein
MTSFSVSKKAFQNSDIVNLGDLEFVERSNKIRVEKLLNGLPIILGEYNAPTDKRLQTKGRQVLLMDLCLRRLLPPSIRDGAEVF